MPILTLLNGDILGGSNQAVDTRRFYRVNLAPPEYNPAFFETAPTMWAAAYEFEQRLAAGNRRALEQWSCLLLLHYCRILRLINWNEEELAEGKYDPDLWPVLTRTFPRSKAEFGKLSVLMTSDFLVIGACYPSVIFFPGRGVKWAASFDLAPYLDDDKSALSWQKCRDTLIGANAEVENQFKAHLQNVLTHLSAQNPDVQSRVAQFCEQEFSLGIHTLHLAPNLPGEAAAIGSDPSKWTRLNEDKNARYFLDKYPLVREKVVTIGENSETHRTYYFVEGMSAELNGWISTPIALGMPTPSQYKQGLDKTVMVTFNEGENSTCVLLKNEQIVQLKDCFLESPAYCGMSSADAVPAINGLHIEDIAEKPLHKTVQESGGSKNKIAVWLAPISKTFLREFPQIVASASDVKRTTTSEDKVIWSFKLTSDRVGEKPIDFPINWESRPYSSQTLSNLGVALWPPQTDPDWALYTAYGTAGIYQDDKQQTRRAERWVLVGEQGPASNTIEFDADLSSTYASLLHGSQSSNRPIALLLLGKSGTESGVAFLTGLEERAGKPLQSVVLSVDFGTTNTSLAFADTTSAFSRAAKPKQLNFSLIPRMLWGKKQDFEEASAPGFVPFDWGAAEGVFPSVLLRKRGGWTPDFSDISQDLQTNLETEHLWRAGIPALYKDEAITNSLYEGKYEKTTWTKYDDMKWSDDPEERSARAIFLGRTLLYACAELFFNQNAKAEQIAFTYPLAFSESRLQGFEEDSTAIANAVRVFCYTKPIAEAEVLTISESRAVASYGDQEANLETLELFIDTGGMTTDLALRHNTDYLVLDSFKVAGSAYFAFAENNLEPDNQLRGAKRFREHLGNLLQNKPPKQELDLPKNTAFKSFYSLLIARQSTAVFTKKERSILDHGMGEANASELTSYQRYRTQLFFKHLLAYALLQACAASVEKGRRLNTDSDSLTIDITLGGNAWGFLMFGEIDRSANGIQEIAKSILKVVKDKLTPHLTAEEKAAVDKLEVGTVRLLNEKTLAEAKTAVALGALKANRAQTIDHTRAAPYSGINLTVQSDKSTTPGEMRWCDHWTKDTIRERSGHKEDTLKGVAVKTLGKLSDPIHPATLIFTLLNGEIELSANQWKNINSALSNMNRFRDGDRLVAPLNYFIGYLYSGDESESILNSMAAEADCYIKPKTATLR
jgi:hypothetical protein